MNALALGLSGAILGVIVHIVFLRHLAPNWRLPLLPILLLLALVALGLSVPSPAGPLNIEDWCVALILTLSVGFAYALVLNGILYDSHTLSLVNAIEAHGPSGMPITEFSAFVAKHPFVQSRIRALVAAGELSIETGELQLTGNAVHLLRLGDAYRQLRGDINSEPG